MANVGEIIRVLRKKRGLSQASLAEKMLMKRSTIGNYERGIREPDLDTVEAFADFFDVSVADMLGREDIPNNDSAQVRPAHTKEGELLAMDMDALPPEIRARALEHTRRIIHEFAEFFSGNQTKN